MRSSLFGTTRDLADFEEEMPQERRFKAFYNRAICHDNLRRVETKIRVKVKANISTRWLGAFVAAKKQ